MLRLQTQSLKFKALFKVFLFVKEKKILKVVRLPKLSHKSVSVFEEEKAYQT